MHFARNIEMNLVIEVLYIAVSQFCVNSKFCYIYRISKMSLQTLVSYHFCFYVRLTSSYAVPDVDNHTLDTGSCPTWHVFESHLQTVKTIKEATVVETYM